jgi:hypothetical protein
MLCIFGLFCAIVHGDSVTKYATSMLGLRLYYISATLAFGSYFATPYSNPLTQTSQIQNPYAGLRSHMGFVLSMCTMRDSVTTHSRFIYLADI